MKVIMYSFMIYSIYIHESCYSVVLVSAISMLSVFKYSFICIDVVCLLYASINVKLHIYYNLNFFLCVSLYRILYIPHLTVVAIISSFYSVCYQCFYAP